MLKDGIAQVSHMDVASNTLAGVRQWSQREAHDELASMADLQACWQPVEGLLKYLTALPQGHYLLSHAPGSTSICVLKAWSGFVSPQVTCCSMSLAGGH